MYATGRGLLLARGRLASIALDAEVDVIEFRKIGSTESEYRREVSRLWTTSNCFHNHEELRRNISLVRRQRVLPAGINSGCSPQIGTIPFSKSV